MAIFNRRVEGSTVAFDADPRPVNRLRSTTGRGAADPVKVWESQPAIRKVVDFLAEAVSVVPWKAMLRDATGAAVDAEGSAIAAMVEHPQPSRKGLGSPSFVTLIEQAVRDYYLHGIGVLALIDGDLVRLPASRLTVSLDHFGRIDGLQFRPDDAEPVNLAGIPAAVVIKAHPTTGAPASPVKTLGDVVDEMRDAASWRRQRFDQSVKAPTLLTRPDNAPKWSKEARDRFLRSWEKWKAGDVEGTPILEHGMQLVKAESVSPRDAQDVETRQLTAVEVCSFFHVAPELLGVRAANFGAVTAQRRALYGTTLRPVIRRLEAALNESVIPHLAGSSGSFLAADISHMTAGSAEERARAYTAATGGPYMTRAEARAAEALPAIEGADELIVPLNVIEGGQASPQDSGAQNISGDAPPDSPAPSDPV